VKVKVRVLKRPWANCWECDKEGAANQVLIAIGGVGIRAWLCDDCVPKLREAIIGALQST
jgi:hypothetical protein